MHWCVPGFCVPLVFAVYRRSLSEGATIDFGRLRDVLRVALTGAAQQPTPPTSPTRKMAPTVVSFPSGLAQMVMDHSQHATLAPGGVGGTYFLQNAEGGSFAVFKPHDEEPCCANNPKGYTTEDESPKGASSASLEHARQRSPSPTQRTLFTSRAHRWHCSWFWVETGNCSLPVGPGMGGCARDTCHEGACKGL